MSPLQAFDALILELTKRKKRWTAAERDLYQSCVRSVARSHLKKVGKDQPNRYGVQQKTWKRWSIDAQIMFNKVYAVFRTQSLVNHPKAKPVQKDHWDTIRWNAAWLAADLVNDPKEEISTYTKRQVLV